MTTPEEVVAQLARGPAWIAGLLASVPAGDVKRRPPSGKWSAHEHACHVAVMEPMWDGRVTRILEEETPAIVSYEPDDDVPDRLLNMDLVRALATFADQRAQLVRRLEALPAAAWQRRATHTSHARYSLFLMCRHMALHDAIHAYRIEESALGSHWPDER